jgi:hypothetical protein
MVDHKFLTMGHSFMQCGQEFGITEKSEKRNQYIFVLDDWVKTVIKTSKHLFSFNE